MTDDIQHTKRHGHKVLYLLSFFSGCFSMFLLIWFFDTTCEGSFDQSERARSQRARAHCEAFCGGPRFELQHSGECTCIYGEIP